MHRPVKVAHSSFIEWSHTTKNTASGYIFDLVPFFVSVLNCLSAPAGPGEKLDTNTD